MIFSRSKSRDSDNNADPDKLSESSSFYKVKEMFNPAQAVILVVFSAAAFAAVNVNMADEPPAENISTERQAILREMRTAVAAMSVSEKEGATLQQAKLIEEPIFRYSDPQRQIIDGTMWVWTIDDLPVMTMKLECCSLPEPERRWLFKRPLYVNQFFRSGSHVEQPASLGFRQAAAFQLHGHHR